MPDWITSPICRDTLSLIPLFAIAIILITKKTTSEWPWLLTLCACIASQRIGELYKFYAYAHQPPGISTRNWHLLVYPRYFYSYWIAETFGAIASLGILIDLKRSVPAAEHIPKRLSLTLTAFAGFIACACIAITSTLEPHSQRYITDLILRFDMGASLAPLIFSLVFVYSISKLGFGFGANQLWIAAILLAKTLHNGLFAFLRIEGLPVVKQINTAADYCLIALFTAWAWFLLRPMPQPSSAEIPMEIKHLQHAIIALEAPHS